MAGSEPNGITPERQLEGIEQRMRRSKFKSVSKKCQ